MEEDVKKAFDEFRRENVALHAETRRHFDTVAERLTHKIQLVAEGLQHVDDKLVRVDEKLDATTTSIDARLTNVESNQRR